jgi:acyl carrier protein
MQNSEESKKDTLSKIQSMLAKEYGLPMERLGPEQALADLGIDSLTTIEFMGGFKSQVQKERHDAA